MTFSMYLQGQDDLSDIHVSTFDSKILQQTSFDDTPSKPFCTRNNRTFVANKIFEYSTSLLILSSLKKNKRESGFTVTHIKPVQ